MARMPLGELLKQQRLIDDLQLRSAIAYQRKWGGKIGQAFVRLGFMDEPVVLENVARQIGVPFVAIENRIISPEVIKLVPEKLMRQRRIIPLALLSENRRGPLIVALSQPDNLHVLDEIAFATGLLIKPVMASEEDIERALARHLDGIIWSVPAASRGFDVPPDPPQSGAKVAVGPLPAVARRRRYQ